MYEWLSPSGKWGVVVLSQKNRSDVKTCFVGKISQNEKQSSSKVVTIMYE